MSLNTKTRRREGTRRSLQIEVVNSSGRRAGCKARLRRQAKKVAGALSCSAGRWCIVLVNDAEMSVMHARTMDDPTTTDVLTFDMREDAGALLDLDTMICVDEAARRAKELGHSVADEVLLYAVHSLLHVCGYDDVTPAKAARMHRREDEILVELGIGARYAPPAAKGETR